MLITCKLYILPQLLSTLGAEEMYETHQELIRRQQNKPEKNYIELTPGMPVWVQHRQNTSWEPATVVSQCTSNSYCLYYVHINNKEILEKMSRKL